MSTLELLETHASFSSAAGRARALAVKLQRQTVVRRGNPHWEVLISSVTALPVSRNDMHESQADENELYGAADEVDEEIAEEIESSRDDFARSKEDGWYYGDETSPDKDGHDSPYGRFAAPRDPHGRTLPSGSGW